MAVDRTKNTSNASPSICNCVNVRRASRAITRMYDKALEPADLKVTQYSALANIMHSGPLNISFFDKIGVRRTMAIALSLLNVGVMFGFVSDLCRNRPHLLGRLHARFSAFGHRLSPCSRSRATHKQGRSPRIGGSGGKLIPLVKFHL